MRSTTISLSKSVLPEFLRLPAELAGVERVLHNKKIVLTRGQEQPTQQIQSLLNEGAEVILFPTIALSGIEISKTEKELIRNRYYSYIIFTSNAAVEYFFGFFSKDEIANIETETKFISIGTKTSETLQQFVKSVFYTNAGTTSTDLLEKLLKMFLSGDTVLLPCSSISKTELLAGLLQIGVDAKQLFIYSTSLPNVRESVPIVKYINQYDIDCYIFTSPSAFTNFLQLMEIDDPSLYFDEKVIAAIGKTTESVISKKGVRVNIIPESPAIEEITKEIIKYHSAKAGK